MTKRVFSGVQPTGNLHLGNYLGAIKQFVEVQDLYESMFCIVDLHAITAGHDPKQLRQNTREIAAAYLACGVNPHESHIFVQSHVPSHSEMQWLLSSVARVGWVERMTQYREKTNSVPPANLRETLGRVKKVLSGSNPHFPEAIPSVLGYPPGLGDPVYVEQSCAFDYNDVLTMYDMLSRATSNREGASVGLLTYPVLMAADILLYQATHVPVGEDQMQHLNLARDIAKKFNSDYGVDYFPIPEAIKVADGARVMSLKDGSSKMSKSAPDDGSRINLTDSDDLILKKIRKATADTLPFPDSPEAVNNASVANLITIYAATSGESREAIYARFGGQGYGVFKPALADALIAVVGPIRDAMTKYLTDTDYLDKVLLLGADNANHIGGDICNKTREIMGFL